MNRRHICRLSTMMILGLAAIATVGAVPSAAFAVTAKQLVGTWREVSAVNTAADGTKTDLWGQNPVGMWIFTADGHFMQTLLRNDLPKIAANNRAQGTADENKAIVQGSNAIFGTYSVADKVLTLKIDASTYPNWSGTEQKHDISTFSRSQFTQSLPGSIGGRTESTWTRIK